MARIEPLNEATVDADAGEILGMVKRKMGSVPNFIATMIHSTAVAKSYLGFSQALSTGTLSLRLREQIALLVGENNGCSYCVSAHTVLGKGTGLNEQEILDARAGVAKDDKEQVALEFVRVLVSRRGSVSDADVEKVRRAGYSDGEIGEIVANTVLNIFTNYFNLVAGTEVDFPKAPELKVA